MTVLSKIADPLTVTCQDFQHPWTNECMNAWAGLLLATIPYCLRVYTIVYACSLLMRRRVPNKRDLRNTFSGILQSSAFLITNGFTFGLYNCLVRNLLGRYYLPTIALVPTFLASFTAILVERPARRPALLLYVANIATETLWNMAKVRGWVCNIPQGRTVIFGMSIAALLYLYRLGALKQQMNDPFFGGIQLFLGKEEANATIASGKQAQTLSDPQSTEDNNNRRRPICLTHISQIIRIYNKMLHFKHKTCPHSNGCIKYAFWGGARPFIGGVTLQLAIKLLMNIPRITQGSRIKWREQLFNRTSLRAGLFLGSFAFMFKSISCLLRHCSGRDNAFFAIPAGLISAVSFNYYPDTTIALYIMWKALQTLFTFGIQHGVLPRIPHATIFLYATFTAILFHAGILEPKTLRPSYFKFLQAISGDRLSRFNTAPFDVFGYETSKQARETIRMLKIVEKSNLPAYAFAS